jgi:glutamyl-tRNA reductase
VQLFLVGTSHSVASTSVRERMHVDIEEMYATLEPLRDARDLLAEALPLVTCGRLELYGVAPDSSRAVRVLGHLMARRTGIPRGDLERHAYVRRDSDVVHHLFRVASGLDSVVHGEAQVLGQVRDAAHHPRARRTAGPVLGRLFQHALRTGKRVRSETEIGRGAASLASAAVGMIQRQVGDLGATSALVIGAGDTGALMARLLVKAGIGRLTVANRTLSKARAVADDLGGFATDLTSIDAALSRVDLVVGASGAPEHLVTLEMIRARPAEARPRCIVDLAHPRTFAPEIARLSGIVLMDLDHVSRRVDAAREARLEHLPRAQLLVEEEARAYETWYRSRESAAVVEAVRRHVLERALTEADRYAGRASDGQREQMRRLARSVARALLHQPTVALRDADPASERGRALLRHASELFGVAEPLDDERIG